MLFLDQDEEQLQCDFMSILLSLAYNGIPLRYSRLMRQMRFVAKWLNYCHCLLVL